MTLHFDEYSPLGLERNENDFPEVSYASKPIENNCNLV